MTDKIYISIDLKSFFASVECVERGLDPLKTNLVVADMSRTEKTICLAVSPSLRAYGISGRARLFEVIQSVKEINAVRLSKVRKNSFTSASYDADALLKDPCAELTFITAPPQMRKYMQYSTDIYNIYLKYVSSDDIHVYSIDEVFIDVTNYLPLYKMTARELAMTMIRDILATTGITATCGIGTNLYLSKIAMDIVAKHAEADEYGVRIAELDERSYRELLWTHEPITDFWRIGRGTAKKLRQYDMHTMGDICRCSIGKATDFYNEDLLYRLFGINAELLIDHAWGYESATIEDIRSYVPKSNSLSSGQVLSTPYTFEKTKIILREMLELLAFDLVRKHLLTDQICVVIGYDNSSLADPEIKARYRGPIAKDAYGRDVPASSNGTVNLGSHSSSTSLITEKALRLFDNIADPLLLVRRITVAANNVITTKKARETVQYKQMDLFDLSAASVTVKEENEAKKEREKRLQNAVLNIREKYGKNAVLKGTSYQEGATTRQRNKQIGGHQAEK